MRYDSDESMGLIFDGNEPLTMAEVAKRLNDAPRWMDRPDRPGTWVCDDSAGRYPPIGVNLTQEMLDKGDPFVSKRVYGPIPEDVQ